MQFKAMLGELVSNIEGATGAIMLEADGEAVIWHAEDDGERLRLRAAYIAVAMRSARASTELLDVGETRCAVFEYDSANFIIQEMEPGYYFALELEIWANLVEALHQIQPVITELRRLVAV